MQHGVGRACYTLQEGSFKGDAVGMRVRVGRVLGAELTVCHAVCLSRSRHATIALCYQLTMLSIRLDVNMPRWQFIILTTHPFISVSGGEANPGRNKEISRERSRVIIEVGRLGG